jgi:hypothetical protein
MNIAKRLLIALLLLHIGNNSAIAQTQGNDGYTNSIAGKEIRSLDEICDNESLDETTREVIVQKYVERISFPVDHCWLHPIPKPKNIINYFEGVPEEAIALDSWHFCTEEGGSSKAYVDKFNMAVKMLQLYSEGKLKTFPKEEIYSTFFSIYNTKSMLESEGYYCNGAIQELLCYRLMEQVVRLCPDIRLLTDMISNDGKVAIIDLKKEFENYPGYYQPLYNMVLFTNADGEKHLFSNSANRVYMIEYNGECGYLLSNHASYPNRRNYNYLACSIITEYGEYIPVEKNKANREWNKINGIAIFNPKDLSWKKCTQNGDLYHQIEGTPTLYLDIENLEFFSR